jgi:oligo-1,6-glucosidase/alpha-glucosidase
MKRILFLLLIDLFPLTNFAQNSAPDVWWKHASIYQIYPRSFKDSNGDGIGDIQAIIDQLDYIKNMGFDAIWLSPFFASPQKDFGYDVSDYIAVDSVYGKQGDAERLIAETHKRGMKIIFDMVMNHTSDEHQWFKESLDSTSAKVDWYIWKSGKGKKAPNNWKNMTGQPGWQYRSERNQWYWGSFLPFQPDLNWRNQEVRDTMFNTVRYWLNQGVDGFRLDIFNVLLEDSLFRDNPHGLNYFPGPENPAGGFQRLRHNFNLPENYQVAKELRKVIDEFPDRFLIGEVDGEHQAIKGFLGNKQDGLNSIFLFDFIYYDFSAPFFEDKIETYEKYYPAPYVPVYVYSNHDNKRSIGRVDNNLDKAKLLALVQLTARGIAVTYQGEEFGSSDLRIPLKEAKDPIAKLFHFPQFVVDRLPWLINRDECRTPMQWNNSANAGFSTSTAKTWLPVNPEYKTINAQMELNDSNSLINVYKSLLHLRETNKILKYGNQQIIKSNEIDKDVYILQRDYQSKNLWILINFSEKNTSIPNFIKANNTILCVGKKCNTNKNTIEIPALSGVILNQME